MRFFLGSIKSEDDGTDSDKDMEDTKDFSPSKNVVKGKRKPQPRKGSKLLQAQVKVETDSESDAGKCYCLVKFKSVNKNEENE